MFTVFIFSERSCYHCLTARNEYCTALQVRWFGDLFFASVFPEMIALLAADSEEALQAAQTRLDNAFKVLLSQMPMIMNRHCSCMHVSN